jgi:hypothetical protein
MEVAQRRFPKRSLNKTQMTDNQLIKKKFNCLENEPMTTPFRPASLLYLSHPIPDNLGSVNHL